MGPEMNDVVNLAGTAGLAAACIYAARYLAGRLEALQEKLLEVLTTTIRDADRTMSETRQTMEETREVMADVRSTLKHVRGET